MFQKITSLALLLCLTCGTAMAAKMIDLPKPKLSGAMSLEESIQKRRSAHEFQTLEISNEQLSQILWAAQGITDTSFGFRAAPSAGALFPLKIYIAKKDGVFRYIPDGHKLLELSKQDVRPSLHRASLNQDAVRDASVDLIITANFTITQARFGERAFRYVCMEIGHVAENIHLQAAALGLGSVPIGSFWDDVVKKTLDIPDSEDPLYIIPVGHPKT